MSKLVTLPTAKAGGFRAVHPVKETMMSDKYRIPFGKLVIGDTARRYIERALSRNWVSEGENVREFERRFAEKFGWRHAIATSSGTDAGIVAWSAVRELEDVTPHTCQGYISKNRGFVATPACAFTATANSILAAGLEPLFTDVSLDTLNIDQRKLTEVLERAKSVSYRCNSIQFVATMGKPTPTRDVAQLALKHDLKIVIDACEAHGAIFEDVEVGHFGHVAIYSFFPAHLIVAGEGGMICTDSDELADLCRSIKCHGYGPGPRFDFIRVGYNSKMNELTAAVGLEGLERFDEIFDKRRRVRAMLYERLSDFQDKLILYDDAPGEIISPHAFPIVLRDPAADVMPLYHHLEQAGIEVKTLFGSLSTDHAAFRFLGHKPGDFPVAERIGRTGLHFSCSEYLTEEDVDYVVNAIKEFVR